MGFLDNLFKTSNSDDFNVGERVRVNYAGIEGIIVSVDKNTCMISYITEDDKEKVETYNKSDISKC